jgi:diguanylate cyclase (GGDEF)-like protein/PAS domain S-box-containing protein
MLTNYGCADSSYFSSSCPVALSQDFNTRNKKQETRNKKQETRNKKQQNESTLHVALKALDATHECIIITDHNNTITYTNPAYEKTTGYRASEILGKNPKFLQSGRQSKEFYKTLWASLNTTGHFEGEMWNRRKNGEFFPEWININTIKNKNNEITHYIGVFSDTTIRKKNEEKIQHYAFYDPLTECPNRRFFIERLNQAIKTCKRDHNLLAVLFIDLDHFKAINDQYGHDIGDQYLCAYSKQAKKTLRDVDTLARFGGDEFVILLTNIESDASALHVGQKLLDIHTLPLESVALNVNSNIGISVFPAHGSSTEDLIKAADAAMYSVKKSTRNGAKLYQDEDGHRP